jgi:WD40 repeat protein
VGEPLRQQGRVNTIVFSPDGKVVVTSGWDGTARLWETATGKPFGAPMMHPDSADTLTFDAAGKELVTACADGIRIWQVARPNMPFVHASPVHALALSPDGKIIATAVGTMQSGEVRLWEAGTGKLTHTLKHEAAARVVAFDPGDGKMLLTAGDDRALRFWDAATGKLLRTLPHPGAVWCAAFHPREGTLLTAGEDRVVRIWDVRTGKVIGTPLKGRERKESLVFSPDGKILLVHHDSTGMLYETATFKQIGGPLWNGDSWFYCGAFAPDSQTLLTGGGDGTARLWEVAALEPHAYREENLAKSKPFRTLLHTQRAPVLAVAFSPDGKTFVTAGSDGTARLWDTATGQPLGTPWRHQDTIMAVAFGPDGRTVLTGSRDRTARLWEVPAPLEGEVEWLQLWVQVLTALELDETGEVHLLDGPTWQRRRQRLDSAKK